MFTSAPIGRPRRPERVPREALRRARMMTLTGRTSSSISIWPENTGSGSLNTENAREVQFSINLAPPTYYWSIAAAGVSSLRQKTTRLESGATRCRPLGEITIGMAVRISTSPTIGVSMCCFATMARAVSQMSPHNRVSPPTAMPWVLPGEITTMMAMTIFTSRTCIAIRAAASPSKSRGWKKCSSNPLRAIGFTAGLPTENLSKSPA